MIRKALIASGLLALASSANAAEPYGRNVTLKEAKAVAAAAEAEAAKTGVAVTITVVEPNGAPVLVWKMDGASYSAPEVSRRKAETATAYRRPTKAFQDAVKGGNLNAISNGALAIEGGELLMVEGRIVGAVGVAGATPEQDGVLARAGAAAVK
ncbi:GlcG/HbpS family heme-binding protein [Caulobacter endophyticus]|uniref:GlcG/HbpS family heme-binding protein n=1 Tax=Caulobacter endophyticus TaxID=2172652 RepID=UPI00240EE589|nr:heme-binding protein [Caulobacter endophyticus]MDG2531835.1 heme-binding protein [Caulobacter endophyticus]